MGTESNERVAARRYQRLEKKKWVSPVKIKGQSLPQRWNSKDLEVGKDLASAWLVRPRILAAWFPSSHLRGVLFTSVYFSIPPSYTHTRTHTCTHIHTHTQTLACTHAPAHTYSQVPVHTPPPQGQSHSPYFPWPHSEKQPPGHFHLYPHQLCSNLLGQLMVSPVLFFWPLPEH